MSLSCLCLLLLCFQDEGITETPIPAFPVADRFSEAIEKFNSVERSDSETLFLEIISELEGLDQLDEDMHLIMTESLKYMGVLKYPDETEAYFEKLIRFDPSFELNARDLPPKIVEVFTVLKQKLVGTVRVIVFDAGTGQSLQDAHFVVDGRDMGTVYGEKVFHVFTGTRQVELRCPNYESYTEEITVTSSEESQVQSSLLRVATRIYLVTQPRGAQVYLNDQLVGATEADPPNMYRARLAEMSISSSEAGALIIDDLMPGTYELRMEQPCYRSGHFTFEVTTPEEKLLQPVRLDRTRATLSVNAASDSKGLVFLNTERVGYLPITDHEICPGNYELRVKFSDGEYIKNIAVEDRSELKITAEPLPSIVWFGLEDDKEGKPPGDMNAWLGNLKQWNLRSVDPNDTSQVPVNPFPLMFSEQTMSEDGAKTLTRMVQGDLYMAARILRRKVVIRNVEVAFWTPLSKQIGVYSFDFREFEKFQKMLLRMDDVPNLTKPWLGIQLARLAGMPGCKVLEVHDKGPLAGQLKAGDFLLSIDGELMRGPGAVCDLKSLDPVVLDASGRQIEATPIATISEVPFDADVIPPQAILARLEKMARYHKQELVRKSALFNQARFQLMLGDYKHAFDIFSTMSLDAPYGINQGTLNYYQGLCFRRLKLTAEATASFKAVLDYPGATLFDAYGPKAAFWAEAELQNPNL